MTGGLILAAALTLVVAGYLSALNISLLRVRRAAVTMALEARGRPVEADWLIRHADAVLQAIAFLRTSARMAFFVLVLVDLIGVGAVLSWRGLIMAAAVSAVLLWLGTTVVAGAVARYVGVNLIATALPLLRFAFWITWPLTRTVVFVDEAVRRLSGANVRDDEQDAEAELLRSIEATAREGSLAPAAAAMLENVVQFSNTTAGQIMTPRTDIEGVELTDDLPMIRAFIQSAGHSRIPVYRDNLDNIVGILYVKDLVRYLGQDARDFHLQPHLRQPIVIPESKPVSELLADFQHSEVHMAIVIDEYGGTAGLITIEDALEEIVGEIQDEHEPEHESPPGMTRFDARRAEADGRYRLIDLNAQLSTHLPEDEPYDTVAGFVVAHLGRVPRAGESFEAHGVRLTVLAAEPTHVQRLAVEVLEPAPDANIA